ncbi:hypothetical protein [Ruminococcus albus]|uniref:hypothetical protein n=1 Tax=Ruminococcus albus TaxID=1264 RepID=UPI0004B7387B|nr:hypothetical protein [Ruminococcus albus]
MNTYIVTSDYGFIKNVSEVKARTRFGAKLKGRKKTCFGFPVKKVTVERVVEE